MGEHRTKRHKRRYLTGPQTSRCGLALADKHLIERGVTCGNCLRLMVIDRATDRREAREALRFHRSHDGVTFRDRMGRPMHHV